MLAIGAAHAQAIGGGGGGAGSGGGGQTTFQSAGPGQTVTVGSNTTLTVPSGAKCAQFSISGANAYRTSDGTPPSGSNGTILVAGSQWPDCGPLTAYQFTAASGTPVLNVEYFK
jgi:hypothetical protein